MKLSLKLLALILSASFCLQASANTITVTSTADSGPNTLRAALAGAAANDTIDFNLTYPATITLTSGQLDVVTSVTISGPGANQLAVNGGGNSRVFFIDSGNTVTIDGLTITNGVAGGIGGNNGGAIYNHHATLTVSNCTLTGNYAENLGGGIFNWGEISGSATLTIANSTLSGNSVGYYGVGGGISNDGESSGSATVTIKNSTLSGNSAGERGYGGGIFNGGFSGSATLTIKNSTLNGNSAGNYGGNIYLEGGDIVDTTLTIEDTILNAGASGGNIWNRGGTVTSLGYNLSSDVGVTNDHGGTGDLNAIGDQINTNPLLGPLQDNGGPTFTHALLIGSPAIDMGNPTFTPPPNYDQRGPVFDRVVNGRIDIGAFELESSAPCPQPQGYWKNNPNAWPESALPMTLGSQPYIKSELLGILRTPVGKGPKADASLILADQLIAARLNIANGADATPVTSTINDANTVLSLYSGKLPYRVRTNSPNGHRMVNDAATLENYNKGLLTAGCSP